MSERGWFGSYRRGEVGGRRFAITFDDGPLPGATDAILDTLAELRAPATFFVIGRAAERWPALVKRMHDDGHTVANHTYDHWRHAMWRGVWYWQEQIERTDLVIERIIGRRPAMFRPPFGVRTPINKWVIHRSGHACVMWTRRAMDGVRTTPEKIERRLLATAADGDVLVLHDGRELKSTRDFMPTVRALPRVIRAFRERGLEPSPLPRLLGIDAYRPLVPSPGSPGGG